MGLAYYKIHHNQWPNWIYSSFEAAFSTTRSSNSLQHPELPAKVGNEWQRSASPYPISCPNQTKLSWRRPKESGVLLMAEIRPAPPKMYKNPANIGRSFTIGCAGFLKHQQYFQKAFAFSLSRPADARFDDWSCSSVWDQIIQKQQKHGESQLVIKQPSSSKLTWQWKITFFFNRYIFNPGSFSIA